MVRCPDRRPWHFSGGLRPRTLYTLPPSLKHGDLAEALRREAAAGAPHPRSARVVAGSLRRCFNTLSVPQRLAGLERVRDAFLRLPFTAQAEERFALEIQQLLFGQRGRRRDVPAGKDPRQLSSDQRVVVGDAARAPGEMDAELQRGERRRSSDRNPGGLRRT